MSHKEDFSDEELIQCLQCEGFVENMVFKLKALMQNKINSCPFKLLKQVIDKLNLRNQPKGVKQIDIIQKFCQFLSPKECFEKIVLVCKDWNLAVKTIRFQSCICVYTLQDTCMNSFTYEGSSEVFEELNQKLFSNIISHAKKIEMIELWGLQKPYLPEVVSLANSHANHLTYCDISTIENFSEMIQTSKNTLSFLITNPESVEGIWDTSFPKLTYLSLGVDETTNCVENLIPFFENISHYMEKLQTIELKDFSLDRVHVMEKMSDYIAFNLEKHCICGDNGWAHYFPLKMVKEIDFDYQFEEVECRYSSKIQYAQIETTFESLSKIKIFLSYCQNLKGILISIKDRSGPDPYAKLSFLEILKDGKNEKVNAIGELLQKSGIEIISWEQWNKYYKAFYENTWELIFEQMS